MITFFLVKQENNIIENWDVSWARIEMRMRNFSEYIHTYYNITSSFSAKSDRGRNIRINFSGESIGGTLSDGRFTIVSLKSENFRQYDNCQLSLYDLYIRSKWIIDLISEWWRVYSPAIDISAVIVWLKNKTILIRKKKSCSMIKRQRFQNIKLI